MSEPQVHWGFWKHQPHKALAGESGIRSYPFSEFVPLESADKHAWISPVLCSVPFGTVKCASGSGNSFPPGHRFVLEACSGDDGECASLDMDEHDARRLAACWNATQGIPTEVLENVRFIRWFNDILEVKWKTDDGKEVEASILPPSQP